VNLAAWRASLRIARRDALRHKARSFLVVLMIGLPIVGVVSVDVLYRSSQLTASERLPRTLGDADALVRSGFGGTAIAQAPDGSAWELPTSSPQDGQPQPLTLAQVRAVLPAGSQLVTWRVGSAELQRANQPGQLVTIDALDYTNPAAGGIFVQRTGRAPRTTHEVALSTVTARHLDVHAGDTVTMRLSSGAPASYLVTGTVQQRFHPNAGLAVVTPAALPADTGNFAVASTEFLVRSSQAITWSDVERANGIGAVIIARSIVEHPPPRSAVPYFRPGQGVTFGPSGSTHPSTTAIATVAVIAVMCMLEIVFLAGPAFAIGARTQRRQLGLVIASGGQPRDARNVVLAGGIVLGAIGGSLGVLVGVSAALTIRHWRISTGADFGGLHFHGVEILGAAAVAVVAGTLAAVMPARAAAHHDVVAALAGRRPATRLRRRVSVVGLMVVAAGVALTAYGAIRNPQSADIAYGSALAELGLAACIPALVTVAGGLARWLPLAPRLAVRDAARNRTRTASAAAAVMAAVAGMVAVGIYAASNDLAAKRNYVPELRAGQSAIALWNNTNTGRAQQVAAAAAAVLPVRATALVDTPPICDVSSTNCLSYQPLRPTSQLCPSPPAPSATQAQIRDWETDQRCTQPGPGGYLFGQVVIGGPDLLRLIAGHDDPAADRALNAGGAVVFSPLYLDDGRVSVETDTSHTNGQPTPTNTMTFNAAAVPGPLDPSQQDGSQEALTPQLLLSPAAARALDIAPVATGVMLDTTRTPTVAEQRKADHAIGVIDGEYALIVERGYHGHLPLELFFLAIAAGFVTIGAAGAATGLAIADGRTDQATLVAIGAAPSTRRRLAMATAGCIALIGAALGGATGFVPALGILRAHQTLLHPQGRLTGIAYGQATTTQGTQYFSAATTAIAHVAVSIPWLLIAAVVAGLPLLAAICAGAFTRSGKVLKRRVA
jgi:putative ABC transport system permease protein